MHFVGMLRLTPYLPQNQERANGGKKLIHDVIKICVDIVRGFPFKLSLFLFKFFSGAESH